MDNTPKNTSILNKEKKASMLKDLPFKAIGPYVSELNSEKPYFSLLFSHLKYTVLKA
jgi:hypothetical protein